MDAGVIERNNVKVSGQGTQPMLFAHGFGCDQHMWRFVAPAFHDDYKVVLFDYVGCGKSELEAYDPIRYGTLAGYAQDVLDVVHALDLRDVVFVGHSVSSMVGVGAAHPPPHPVAPRGRRTARSRLSRRSGRPAPPPRPASRPESPRSGRRSG